MFKIIYKIGLTFILVWSPIVFGAMPKRVWSITPVLLVIYLLVFLWLWKINNEENRDSPLRGQSLFSNAIRNTALDKPILLFVILAIISFIFSIYKHDSFYALLRLVAYVGLFYLIVNNYSRELRQYLIGLIICIGTGLSIYGLLQYFGVLPHSWWAPPNFLAATYVNHNHFAGYLELVIPVAVGVIVGRLLRPLPRPRNDRMLILLLITSLTVMITAFVFAQSRGAWISLGISLFVMNIVLIKRKMLKKESLFIFLLLVALVFAFFYSNEGLVSKRIETVKDVATGEPSMKVRLDIWDGTVNMILHNPLIGVGIGDFRWGFPQYRTAELASIGPHYAHNDYLHMTGEMGVLALVLMVLIFVRIIGMGLTKKGAGPIIIGCAIGVLSLSLHGLVDFNFHIPANMVLFIVYSAFIVKES